MKAINKLKTLWKAINNLKQIWNLKHKAIDKLKANK